MKANDKKKGNHPVKDKSRESLKNKATGNQLAKEETDPIKRSRSEKDSKGDNSNDVIALDETIRNDIRKTDINPNAPRREPTIEGGQTEAEEQLNKDMKIVNEQEDAIKRDKYQGL
jgi:hypothetical protein